MQWLVLVTAYILLVMFLVGVLDIVLNLFDLFASGRFTDPLALIDLLNTVLLLLIIVEVHRTLVAYVRDEPVVPIVIGVAIIAVARNIIGFRVGGFETSADALLAAGAFGLLLTVLLAAYFLVTIRPRE